MSLDLRAACSVHVEQHAVCMHPACCSSESMVLKVDELSDWKSLNCKIILRYYYHHHHRFLMQTVEPNNCRQMAIWIMSRFTPGLACTHLTSGCFVMICCHYDLFTLSIVFVSVICCPSKLPNSQPGCCE
jgi:hypothetical protein